MSKRNISIIIQSGLFKGNLSEALFYRDRYDSYTAVKIKKM